MRLFLFLFAIMPGSLAAHEFWIAPEAYMIEGSAQITANLKVGENFSGTSYPFLEPNFKRFELVEGAVTRQVEGRAGDLPALAQPPLGEGLVVVVHETRDLMLTYSDWEKFVNFTRHKDHPDAPAQHLSRGLPDTGFREEYTRYAKSLIAVGAGEGSDSIVGLRTEILAEANPYTAPPENGLPVRVFLDGAPRAQVQIELFERTPDGTVGITLHRTDDTGRATLPIRSGHEYLVDSVVIEPVEPTTETDPVWRSLWASLTFRVP